MDGERETRGGSLQARLARLGASDAAGAGPPARRPRARRAVRPGDRRPAARRRTSTCCCSRWAGSARRRTRGAARADAVVAALDDGRGAARPGVRGPRAVRRAGGAPGAPSRALGRAAAGARRPAARAGRSPARRGCGPRRRRAGRRPVLAGRARRAARGVPPPAAAASPPTTWPATPSWTRTSPASCPTWPMPRWRRARRSPGPSCRPTPRRCRLAVVGDGQVRRPRAELRQRRRRAVRRRAPEGTRRGGGARHGDPAGPGH